MKFAFEIVAVSHTTLFEGNQSPAHSPDLDRRVSTSLTLSPGRSQMKRGGRSAGVPDGLFCFRDRAQGRPSGTVAARPRRNQQPGFALSLCPRLRAPKCPETEVASTMVHHGRGLCPEGPQPRSPLSTQPKTRCFPSMLGPPISGRLPRGDGREVPQRELRTHRGCGQLLSLRLWTLNFEPFGQHN
jgi:hypothetical protein